MPSTNGNPHRPPGPDHARTDLNQTPKAKSEGVVTSRRSAPARFPAPFVYPAAPASLFLPLTVKIFPGDTSVMVDASPLADSHPAFQEAVTRLSDLVTRGILTINQSKLLQAAMTTAQSLVASGEVHSLLKTIVSPSTFDSAFPNLASVVDAGLKSFIAHSGPSTNTTDVASSGSSSSRNENVISLCTARDRNTCVVTGVHTGSSCHIIPFSVRGEKAKHFWALVAMFNGWSTTELLKRLTLGDPPTTDNIQNVIWLSLAAHSDFDSGKLAIVPVITSMAYDPTTVSEYDARIELPYGDNACELPVLTNTADGERRLDMLRSGYTITLRTPNPAILPLPHPILLQLHTAFTRLRKLCASAGIPILPDNADSEGGDDMAISDNYSEVDYQAMLDDSDDTPPQFAENDIWPTTTHGLPLKEQFLQLLCGSEASESEQYYHVMDNWDWNDVGGSDYELEERNFAKEMLDRNRPYELLDRNETGGERSRPATELMWTKGPWDSP